MKTTVKKFISVLLVSLMLLTIAPLSGFVGLELPEIPWTEIFTTKAGAATNGTCGTNFTWTLDDEGTLTITGAGAMTNYSSVPWYQNRNSVKKVIIEKGVTSIGDSAFSGCSSLTAIEIPEGVTSIGDSAFYYCSALESIDIPDGVISIGDSAFRNCISLNSVKLSKTLLTIGFDAFYHCESLRKIEIPVGVTVIPEFAFSDCYQLVEVTFSENSQLVMISSWAFQGCNNLSYIEIPKKLRNIGPGAFANVTNVDVKIDDLSAWCKITFDDHFSQWNLYHNEALVESLYIPDDVEAISDWAFCGCSSITEIKASDSGKLISIGVGSFQGCESLQKVYIPKNVKYIENYAFAVCDNLTDVFFAEESELFSIGSEAFSNCWALKQIILPASVTSIGEYAFSQTSLSDGFFIPSDSKLEYIGDFAFLYSSLPSIEIPKTVKELGENPFAACLRMKQISVNVDNKKYCSVDGVLYSKDMTELICYPGAKTGATYIIPASVLKILSHAFMWNENIQFVSFEEDCKLEKLEYDSFSCCTNLVSITLPETLIFIDDFSFFQCFDLTDVFFMGTQEKWNNIEILGQDWGNLWLILADIHFDSTCRHLSLVYLEPQEASCVQEGLSAGLGCFDCGFVFLEQKTIEKFPHTETIINQISPSYDENGFSGDVVCSVCGELLENGYKIPALTCDHICHKDGILSFFWKIIQFFQKLFRINPMCECGVAHY